MSLHFSSVLVVITEGCHVGCSHCGFLGSPRDREAGADDIAEWVGQAIDYGIPSITFTGGEPFERLDVLATATAVTCERNGSSSVFTSCSWAKTFEQAAKVLELLPGLEHLYLSTDVYHQRRVPYRNVYNAIDAADRLGIPKVTLCITYTTESDLNEVKNKYAQYADRVRFHEERVIPTPYIKKALRGQDPLIQPEPDRFPSVCWVDTPIINPNGDVFSCHVGKAGAHQDLSEIPYWLGNLGEQSFEAIMKKASTRLGYQFLRTHGPKGIAAVHRANPELAGKLGRDGFTNSCDLCFSTLSTRAGVDALKQYVGRPKVRLEIDIRLALRFGEFSVGSSASVSDKGCQE